MTHQAKCPAHGKRSQILVQIEEHIGSGAGACEADLGRPGRGNLEGTTGRAAHTGGGGERRCELKNWWREWRHRKEDRHGAGEYITAARAARAGAKPGTVASTRCRVRRCAWTARGWLAGATLCNILSKCQPIKNNHRALRRTVDICTSPHCEASEGCRAVSFVLAAAVVCIQYVHLLWAHNIIVERKINGLVSHALWLRNTDRLAFFHRRRGHFFPSAQFGV
ncbi:hypothetical protein B0H19DRAFT_1242428 [Mycena capillaripes]|nr:hypothetical protein B0H19DRAFT_1242428 [Mycena capillaripes]